MSATTTKETLQMIHRGWVRSARGPASKFVLAAWAVLIAWSLSAAPAHAATPTPAWAIQTTGFPTNFVAGSVGSILKGPGYFILVTNVGGAPTSEPFSVTDTLPTGLTPKPSSAQYRNNSVSMTCSVSGQTVTCTSPATPLRPGESAWVRIPVTVAAPAPGESVENEATVSGGGAAVAVSGPVETDITSALPAFDFVDGPAGFWYGKATDPDGSTATQAGSHPYQLAVGMNFPYQSVGLGQFIGIGGGVKDIVTDLPRGAVVDPTATPVRCTEPELESGSYLDSDPGCPEASQVGSVAVVTSLTSPTAATFPLYNMVPPAGKAAELGFEALNLGLYIHIFGGVRSDGEYQLTADSSDILSRPNNPILGLAVELWGDPSDESHDDLRGLCQYAGKGFTPLEATCPTGRTNKAFVTLPSACSGPQAVTAEASSWEEPEVFRRREAQSIDATGGPAGVEGCSKLSFEPSMAVKPEVSSDDSPTGLEVDIHVPQNGEFEDESTGEPRLAEANLKDTTVTLPEGLVVNPSAAAGLGACTEAQFDLHGGEPAGCPDAAKLGTVEVVTPLLEDPLPGAVYLATPRENEFGSLLALYIAVHDPKSGVVIKLAGKVEPDPSTGRLTATFDENPELPFEDFRLKFFGGPRASLRTPAVCATYAAKGEFTPWSGTAAVGSESSFPVSGSATGGPCPGTSSAEPNSPSFEAGTQSPLAGSFSPFVLKLSRADGSQEFRTLNVALPPGLTGKLAGIPYCSDAALAGAESRTGRAEQASPSCPSASEVGTVTVGAGSGSQPYYVSGHAYLAGPYKGAPLSLAIITPAVAGPFDLGTVVVRAGLYVNQETAQITVKSDPIPSILEGIPLDVRSIAVSINRNQFTLNPTSCEVMEVAGESISTQGQVAKLSNRFQAAGCSSLPFRPKLKLQVIGKTNRNAKPRLKAVLTTKPGEADIRRAQVNLPHSMFLEQGHIKTVCTRVQWAEGNGNGSACPKGSIYGRAVAWTPLLDHPLEGYVYLRSNGGERKLPDLVAALNGQVSIALWGKTDSGPNKGLRNTFEVVPDAPVSRFVLELNGKKKGLLVNSEPLCSKKAKRHAIVRFTDQNGKVESLYPKVAASCPKPKKKSGEGGKKK